MLAEGSSVKSSTEQSWPSDPKAKVGGCYFQEGVWILAKNESAIKSVEYHDMHISPHSCITNQTALCYPWLCPVNPMSASLSED